MVCLSAASWWESDIVVTVFSSVRPRRLEIMAEVAPAPAAAAAAAPAKAAKKKSASKPSRSGPSVQELIVKAVSASKERKGVSTAALKKQLAAGGYDVEKNKSRVKVAIKALVAKGTLLQTKGTGASGSFKLAKKVAEPKKKKQPVAPKKSPAKAKKPAAKKAAAKKPKAAAAAKKPAAKKSPKKPKKPAAAPKKAAAAKSPKKTSKSPKKPAKKAPAAKKSPAKKVAKPKAKKAAPKKK